MKDAFYFPHDSNAKDDPKCTMLIEQLGLEGYGIFWVLIETLRDQPDYKYPLKLIPSLARKYNTTFEKMNVVINNYNLFEIDSGTFFYSESLNKRMQIFEIKREKQRIKANKRWNKDATALPQYNHGNASKVKYSKVNKSIVYEIKEYENTEDKLLFQDHIELTYKEYMKLIEKYGESQTNIMIDKLNNWFLADTRKLKNYTSHYGCINNWVVDWYNKDYKPKESNSIIW